MRKVQLSTLGCSKNLVDSEHLLRQISAAGMKISPEGTDLTKTDVDILIINTCGFIKDAKEESIEAIFDGVEAKKRGHISKLYVFGCLSQRYGQELKEEIPEVDGFFGAFDIEGVLREMGITRNPLLLNERLITTPSHFSYLKISEGCDRKCSYCAIPGIRGKNISTPIDDLVEEANYLVDKGVKELILVAQDTTYYGLDLYKDRALGRLLERLVKINNLDWIRIHYSYPDSFPEDVLHIMADSEKICNYIDIPLQHSSTKVLKAMRRSITGEETRNLIQKIRSIVPNVVLRTTMIVGHPGEGEAEFDDLLDFVKEARFERLGAFTYSEEEGTWGAENLKDDISEEEKNERYDELMELQAEISSNYNQSRIGSVERVIIDSILEDGVMVARSEKESPEVDGEILIKDNVCPDIIGKFVSVKIDSADEYDLTATIVY